MRPREGRKTLAVQQHAVIHRNGGVPIYPHAVADGVSAWGDTRLFMDLRLPSRQAVAGFVWLISSSTRPFVSTPTNQSAMAATRYATAKV